MKNREKRGKNEKNGGNTDKKDRAKRVVVDYICIIFGTFLIALGIGVFMAPNKISPGGVTALGTVFLHIFGIRLSVTNLVLNALLFVLGYKYLGKYAVVKTVSGIALLSLFLEFADLIPKYTGEKVDMFMASVIGGLLMGVGVGFVIRHEGSTGGSDFAALIIKRFFPHFSIANIIMVIDCVIIIASAIVFGTFEVAFYSAVTLFVASRVADILLTMGNSAKTVQIFSSKNEEISRVVLEELDRGITGIHCKGMYSGKDGMMLLCVVTPKQLPILINRVRRIDKGAFIVVNDTKEVLGKGFALESSYDKIK